MSNSVNALDRAYLESLYLRFAEALIARFNVWVQSDSVGTKLTPRTEFTETGTNWLLEARALLPSVIHAHSQDILAMPEAMARETGKSGPGQGWTLHN